MDTTNKIKSFEIIGMVDPFMAKKSMQEAIKGAKKIDFNEPVYPKGVMKAKTNLKLIESGFRPKPPKTIFLPTKRLLRTMIRAALQFSDEETPQFLLRFGLVEHIGDVDTTTTFET